MTEENGQEIPRAPNPKRVAAMAKAREAAKAAREAKAESVNQEPTKKDVDPKTSLDRIHEKTFWGNALNAAIMACGINTPQKLNQAVQVADAALELYRKK